MSPLPLRPFRTRGGETLAFSAMGFGGAPLGNLYKPLPESEARATLDAAFDAGCRYFDTAPLYGLGLSETRLNPFLRAKRGQGLVLSSKIGRLLQRCPPQERDQQDYYIDTPSRRLLNDYSYDGVMRSVEASLERLGVDRINILYAHDIDAATHGEEASEAHIKAFLDGGCRALTELRDQGVIAAFGAGLNEWQMCERLARAGDFDMFLLAGRYTLLEQEALDSFLPLCLEKGIGIALGGPFNSGILATGPVPGAYYNYAPAPPDILARVARIEAVCKAHGVSLAEAALAFPFGHKAVVSVIPGARSPQEVARNRAMLGKTLPAGLWADLKTEKLLRPDAPTPDTPLC